MGPETLNISFNEVQVCITTDVPELVEFIEKTYRPALVATPSLQRVVGELRIMKSDGQFYEIVGPKILKWGYVTIDPLLSYIKREVHELFMAALPQVVWIHAAAVEKAGTALLLCGPSGVGKSTLSLLLGDNGWRLMSDDVAPILGIKTVLPFFQGATRRIRTGDFVEGLDITLLPREEVLIAAQALQLDPMPVSTIVFPVFEASMSAALTPLKAGEAAMELIRNIASLPLQKNDAIGRACTLVEAVSCYRLAYGDGKSALSELARIG